MGFGTDARGRDHSYSGDLRELGSQLAKASAVGYSRRRKEPRAGRGREKIGLTRLWGGAVEKVRGS